MAIAQRLKPERLKPQLWASKVVRHRHHLLVIVVGLLLWLLGSVLAPPVTGAPLSDSLPSDPRSSHPLLFHPLSLPLGTLNSSRSAVSDLASQPTTNVRVSLGNTAGALVFEPNQFTFQSGKRYKLLLSNPSPQKHYFTAQDFSNAIWTQKVDTGTVEIKGAIHDLEIRPGGTAEWVFVPVRPGSYGVRCHIAGHTEAGMTGTIEIFGAA